MRPLHSLIALFLAAAAHASTAADVPGPLLSFSVDASRSVPNDLARAGAFMAATEASPAEVARHVNTAIAQALALAKTYSTVHTRSGETWTAPTYGKNNRAIESWQMRSELLFESRDIAALSELLGKLQATLAVGQIALQAAPETRKKAEDEALLEAVAAFRERAQRVADALGRKYRIRTMNVAGGGRGPTGMATRAMAADAAPLPVAAGDSQITVRIAGEVELTD